MPDDSKISHKSAQNDIIRHRSTFSSKDRFVETALQLLAFGLFLGFLIFMLDGGGDKIVKVIDRHLTGMRENNASQSQVAELQRQLKEQELTFYRFKSTTEGKLAELSQQLQYLEKEK